jgi:voltage-gated potassium channel
LFLWRNTKDKGFLEHKNFLLKIKISKRKPYPKTFKLVFLIERMAKKDVVTRFWATLFLLVILIGLGAQIYHMVEKWSYFDSLYFTIITITTIGYGDIYPIPFYGKIFTMIFPFIGIGIALYLFSVTGAYFFKKMMQEIDKFSSHKEKADIKKLKEVEKILKKSN